MPLDYRAYLTGSLLACTRALRCRLRLGDCTLTYADLATLAAMDAELAARELGL